MRLLLGIRSEGRGYLHTLLAHDGSGLGAIGRLFDAAAGASLMAALGVCHPPGAGPPSLAACGLLLENQPGSPAAHPPRRYVTMSEQTPSANAAGYGPIKTIAVRINESVRAQLDIIAQLNDRTVTDEIRLALEAWIERTKSDPSVLQRAESVRAEIEREAATKRSAIAAIFDAPAPTASRSNASAARSSKPDSSK